MKGNCGIVECQLCNQQLSFGRIRSHTTAKHKNITWLEYINKFWETLPLHQPCEVCNTNIVYKYKTCSKKCHSKLRSDIFKGVPKPDSFMSKEHREKLSIAHTGKIIPKEVGEKISKNSKGISKNKGKKSHLGFSQSDYQKQKAREAINLSKPWTKVITHTPETIAKIFQKRKMNKLEEFVSFILESNKIEYYHQFFLKTASNICKSYDFKIKNQNILLEVDGDYWHGGPSLEKHFFKLEEVKKNDIFKDNLAQENDYILLRFWESEIYNNPNIIIEKINNVCIQKIKRI